MPNQDQEQDPIKLIQLRLPESLRDRIDQSRKSRPVPVSRHMWILEAIHEKLSTEEK